MYDTIMVPLDGSAFSEQAIPVAAAIARRERARLRLVHVHEPLYGEVSEEMGKRVEAYLEDVARRIALASGVRVDTRRLVGRVVEQLMSFADAAAVDLIVLTTHGRSGFSRAWLGSVADALIRGAGVPVLAMRPAVDAASGGSPAEPSAFPAPGVFRRVLVPLDGSELAESVLEHATALGGPEAAYTLLAVVPAPAPGELGAVRFGLAPDRVEVERRRAEVGRYLARVTERIRRGPSRVEGVTRVAALPALAILEYAAQHGVDLIAMATHGCGGIRRWVLGSVADKVVRGAECPVLVLRPRTP